MSKTPAANAVGDLTLVEVASGRLFIWFAGSAVPDCARDYLREGSPQGRIGEVIRILPSPAHSEMCFYSAQAAEFLAHHHDVATFVWLDRGDRARRKKNNNRRAHVEAAHFLTFLEDDIAARPVTVHNFPAARWRHHA